MDIFDDELTAPDTTIHDNKGVRFSWAVDVGQIIIALPVLAGLAAVLWEGGQVQATMETDLRAERDMRQQQYASLNHEVIQVGDDVRELRLYVMGHAAQFRLDK